MVELAQDAYYYVEFDTIDDAREFKEYMSGEIGFPESQMILQESPVELILDTPQAYMDTISALDLYLSTTTPRWKGRYTFYET